MPKAMDVALFDVADTLGVELLESGGKIKGQIWKEFEIGPWNLETKIVVTSDALSYKWCSFFVQVIGDLWFYIVRDLKLRVYVVDGGLAKLGPNFYGGVAPGHTLCKLAPAITTSFEFINDEWRELDASIMGEPEQAKDSIPSFPAPKGCTD